MNKPSALMNGTLVRAVTRSNADERMLRCIRTFKCSHDAAPAAALRFDLDARKYLRQVPQTIWQEAPQLVVMLGVLTSRGEDQLAARFEHAISRIAAGGLGTYWSTSLHSTRSRLSVRIGICSAEMIAPTAPSNCRSRPK